MVVDATPLCEESQLTSNINSGLPNLQAVDWGYAKRVYRKIPPSKSDKKLIRNVQLDLDSVPLVVMHRYLYFAYFLGLI